MVVIPWVEISIWATHSLSLISPVQVTFVLTAALLGMAVSLLAITDSLLAATVSLLVTVIALLVGVVDSLLAMAVSLLLMVTALLVGVVDSLLVMTASLLVMVSLLAGLTTSYAGAEEDSSQAINVSAIEAATKRDLKFIKNSLYQIGANITKRKEGNG